jgi:RNA polymerase sigma-70 factor (ECF subfamily)
MTADSGTKEEEHMIASILAGNSSEFHDLIRPYERTVYVMALTLLKNEADAEDVAQETFLKAFRSLANFRSEARFSTWLISIALNEARNRLRHANRARTESLDETQDGQPKISPALLRDWREIPSETLERQQVRKLLQQAVADLPLIYRETFLLRDVEELSINETAEMLKISVASVKVRLHRARMMLQRQLAPQLKEANPKRRWLPWS